MENQKYYIKSSDTNNSYFARTRKSAIILNSLVRKNVKNQYRRSVLGIFWTILNPLLTMIVMAFVFSNLFGRANISLDYPIYVLSGNIVFTLMRASTTNALPCIVNNYDLLCKTRIKQEIFPMSQVASNLVNFLFSLIALVIVMLIRIPNGVTFHWTMLMIFLPWLPSILMFTLGISYILSAIYVRFRDIKYIYSVLLTLWTYLTPLFYSIESLKLSKTALQIMQLNPMLHYVNYFRDLLMGIVPSWETHLICYGAGILSLIIGMIVFKHAKKKFILYI